MDKNELSPEILQKLQELQQKYNLTGQSLSDNLEGLLHEKYLKYWKYIHLDTLLSLQDCRTQFPDELVFLVYHQITELYFKLILWEIKQLAQVENPSVDFFTERINRLNRYFKMLIFSYDIMVEGMDIEQFRQFRMALLPASGFQSVQFRKIEICATDFINLLSPAQQQNFTNESEISSMFDKIYWKEGATDEHTQKGTITAQYFQDKYGKELLHLAQEYKSKNIWQKFLQLSKPETLKEPLRTFDSLVNVEWRLTHFRSAVRYLKNDDATIDATGGTNWQKYLPPRFQKRMFYPELWTETEKDEWGRKKMTELMH